jgi:hypothetical protein
MAAGWNPSQKTGCSCSLISDRMRVAQCRKGERIDRRER